MDLKLLSFPLCVIILLALSDCGPGRSPDDNGPQETDFAEKKSEKAGRDAPGIHPDKENGMAWEPEFFVIPESRLGAVAESPGLPPDLIPEEDLWIIVRTQRTAPLTSEKLAGVSIRDTRGAGIQLSVQHTAITSRILGCVSDVSMNHRFYFNAESPADLVYSIVLPNNAGLSDFLLTIGERRIRGIVHERENAEKIFEMARNRGLVASLIEDSGDNLIEGRIHAVPPETEIISTFRYCATLPYIDGHFRFSCPLTVTQSDHSKVDAVESSISVSLEAGMPIKSIFSPTHHLDIIRLSDDRAEIRSESLPRVSSPSQFILEYDISGDTTQAALFIDRSSDPGHAVLLMMPPRSYETIPRIPVEVSILLDCSRSMRGKKLFTAKKAAECILDNLNDDDTFRVTSFSGRSLTASPGISTASSRNIRDSIRMIHAAPASDGEGILHGLRKSLSMAEDESAYRILVILTDGYIDDHGEIMRFAGSKMEDVRIFPVVVGASTNTRLIETLASFSRGGLLYIDITDDIRPTIDSFLRTLRRPVLRDIRVDWEHSDSTQSLPARIPDLHVGRPVVVAARFQGDVRSLIISGITGKWRNSIEVTAADYSSRAPALGFIWARKYLAELMHRVTNSSVSELKTEVADIAQRYRIITPFTSFAMVDTRSGQK